jgi:hypothetical protein
MVWSGRRMAARTQKISSHGMEKAVRILTGVVALLIGLLLALVAATN